MATDFENFVMPPIAEYAGIQTEQIALFPYCAINSGKTFAPENSSVMSKCTATYLLLYTVSGQGHILYKDKHIALDRNEAVLIDCAQPFEYSPSKMMKSGEQWVFCWLYFNSLYGKQFCDLFCDNTDGKTSPKSEADVIMQFEQIFDALKEPGIKSACIQSDAISRILTALVTDMDSLAGVAHNDHEYLKRIPSVIHIIERDYWQRISVDTLANAIGLSKYHFTRVFKEYTGIPPYQFIIKQRVNQAKTLLEDTELSMYEISVMTGFYDRANFCKKFKAHTGLAPLDYRKLKNMENSRR